MDELLNGMRWLHAGLGVICLLTGAVAIASKKAAGRHPLAGRIFAVSLILVYASILLNIVVKQNIFMLGIGWLAVYAGIDGWRSLRRFQGRLEPTPQPLDYALVGLCALGALALAVFGARVLVASGNFMGVVCIGFAVLAGFVMRGTVQRLRNPPPRSRWLEAHIGLMSGAFSAAVTAFFAVQFSGRLGSWEWVVWVAPTVLMMTWARREEARRGLR